MSRYVAFRISAGRVFQRDGAATLKALSPKVQSLVWGMESRPASEDRRFRGGVYGWRRSERSCGARAWRDLQVRRRTLYVMQDLIGSLSRVLLGTPDRTPLQ